MIRLAFGAMVVLGLVGVPAAGQAQTKKNDLSGTWKLEKGKVEGNGPRIVVIRSDSSASWGEEIVRWRLKPDTIMIALGGEWETYKIKIRSDRITLSGPDLPEEVTLKRVGPPTPRPANVPVPPDPERVGPR